MDFNKEILKGHIDTLILALLDEKDSYGYEIAKIVKERASFELKDSTMYVSLKRLESKEFIVSYWGDSQYSGGRRKYYNITEYGKNHLTLKIQEWHLLQGVMNNFLKKGN